MKNLVLSFVKYNAKVNFYKIKSLMIGKNKELDRHINKKEKLRAYTRTHINTYTLQLYSYRFTHAPTMQQGLERAIEK